MAPSNPSLLLRFFFFLHSFLDSVDQNIRTKPPESSKIKKKKKTHLSSRAGKAGPAPPKALRGPEPGRAVNKPASLYHTGHQRRARAPPALHKPNPAPFHPKALGGLGEGWGGAGEAFIGDQELPAERGGFSVLTPPPRRTINTPNLQVSSAKCPPLPPKIRTKLGGGGVVQLGSCFSFWIKTPKKRM